MLLILYETLLYSSLTFLIPFQEEVRERIMAYFYNVIRAKLSPIYQSYVIDFALLEDREIVIEVNPFVSTTPHLCTHTHSHTCFSKWNKTGPALFNWEEDRDVIAKGTEDGGFEFRIVERPWMRRRNFFLPVRTP